MRPRTSRSWAAEEILELVRSYQGAAVLAAAADLDLFDPLAARPRTALELSRELRCNGRGLTVLLNALAALRLLRKSAETYSLSPGMASVLTANGRHTMLAMVQHQANCLRRWAELARVVKTGRPARVKPSVRGAAGDKASFIGAMHNVSAPFAGEVIRAVRPLRFKRLLDLGGGSGTWTIQFLHACPSAHAIIFDLAEVIPMAMRRLSTAGLSRRVNFVAGDFLKDPLPKGVDLVWVSAIVHQNSREQNRHLFHQTFQALRPGGRIAIRDILMDEGRTRPVAGALFAVNMLVATEGGGTFTFGELSEDLETAGFSAPAVARRDEGMNSVVIARKPL